MLTATVKLFLKRPAETQKMVQDVLTLATQVRAAAARAARAPRGG